MPIESLSMIERDPFAVLGPHIVARQVNTALQGMKPMWGAGSIRQLGGLVLINEQGRALYRHIANPIYKYPTWESVLETLKAARRHPEGTPAIPQGEWQRSAS